jgi:hypothetical protein
MPAQDDGVGEARRTRSLAERQRIVEEALRLIARLLRPSRVGTD